MASIEKRTRNGKISWRAMYREPDGTQRSRSFSRRVDAERFLTTVEHSKMVGSYLDPSLARVTVGQWAGQWLAGKANLKRPRPSGTPGSCARTSSRAGAL